MDLLSTAVFYVNGTTGTEKTIISKNSGPLVNPEKVFLPLLCIKLGLMKNFVKADKNSIGFMYLKHKFPKSKKGYL
jgi:hypothetical protein